MPRERRHDARQPSAVVAQAAEQLASNSEGAAVVGGPFEAVAVEPFEEVAAEVAVIGLAVVVATRVASCWHPSSRFSVTAVVAIVEPAAAVGEAAAGPFLPTRC